MSFEPPIPTRPALDIPELPDDVTDLSEEDITDLMAKFTNWSNFAWAMVTEYKIHEGTAQDDLDFAEGEALLANWKGGTDARVAVAKAAIATADDVVASRENFRGTKAKRMRYEALAERLDRSAALLSRELTRRTSIQPVRTSKW